MNWCHFFESKLASCANRFWRWNFGNNHRWRVKDFVFLNCLFKKPNKLPHHHIIFSKTKILHFENKVCKTRDKCHGCDILYSFFKRLWEVWAIFFNFFYHHMDKKWNLGAFIWGYCHIYWTQVNFKQFLTFWNVTPVTHIWALFLRTRFILY